MSKHIMNLGMSTSMKTTAMSCPLLFGLFFLIFWGGAWMLYRRTASPHVCVLSHVDGNTYCVRERQQVKKAVDVMARVTKKCGELIQYMDTHALNPELTRRLQKKFKPENFMETLPTSKYEAYSENKGDEVALCLNKHKSVSETDPHLIDEHTLMFVALHELSHICTLTVGHEPEFWKNFRLLLGYAKQAGIHDPQDYSKKETGYCGLTLSDNPYFS